MTSHSLAADVGVPHFCLEPHDRRSERIFVGNLNVDSICTPFVRRARWSSKLAFQVGKVITRYGIRNDI